MSVPGAAASASFDARPLTDPVDSASARAFTQRLRAEGRIGGTLSTGAGVIVALVIGVFAIGIFAFVGSTVMMSVFGAAAAGSNPLLALFGIVPIIIVLAVVAVVVIGLTRGFSVVSHRRYRLDGFARANGMTYVPNVAAPALPGMIFSVGSSRQAEDLVRGERPRFVEFANYRYTTGSGKNRTTHRWGYVAVKLDTPLPNIVLDATSNNGLFGASNLPASFDRDQRLSLEGDFDRYFSLYCPNGYERDALYLFTPDVMARLIDTAAAVDVEIVDDWLFLYARRDVATLDPATWAWLFSVVAALLDKLAQWSRWRDERLATDAGTAHLQSPSGAHQGAASGATASALPFAAPAADLRPPPGVAPQGRRLTRRFSVVGAIATAAFLAIWVWSFVSKLF